MVHIIEIRNLTKTYGELTVVDRLNLGVSRGDIFGFLGHNGAGKTTTINMLTTLLEPTKGSASIAGFDIVKNPMGVRRSIGYVPENVQLYENLTCLENLEFFAKISGLQNPKERITEILELLNAGSYASKRTGELSKGMRQRIGLAQAILHKPSVLFLDEPTSGLDPMGVKELRNIITELNEKEKITIFMNTHLLSEVTKTCKTIGVLSHGKLIYTDTLKNTLKRFSNEDSLERIYFSIEGKNGH